MSFGHEKLDVYRLSLDYAAWAFKFCETLNGHRNARDQIIRASQSIPLNIAEGNAKATEGDRRRFFEIARGSALECAAAQDILHVCGALDREENEAKKVMLNRIASMLTGLGGRGYIVKEVREAYQIRQGGITKFDSESDGDSDPFHLRLRSRTLLTLRHFFHSRGFIEVETPVRLPCPALETHIDAEPSGDWFLRTSPELHMKQLLAAGFERIFQIGPCFRRGERGERHHPEFTMLEWYRAGTDYLGILDDTKALLAAAGLPARPWEILPVSEAFQRWAGWDPAERYDAARFELDLVDKVEPALPRDRAVVLIDYPAEAAALSRRKPGSPHLAERWELYLNGIEIANSYSELTDPVEQRRRFEQAAHERAALDKPVYAMDEAFLAALEAGMPPCGGIALGIDRLAMVLAGATSLDAVIPFRE